MTRKSLSDAEIRTMLAKEFDDISSEDEIEDHDYISSEVDGEIDDIVPALDITDEEIEDYQIFTEQTLATNETLQMSFASNNETEKYSSHPQSD